MGLIALIIYTSLLFLIVHQRFLILITPSKINNADHLQIGNPFLGNTNIDRFPPNICW